MEKVPCVAGVAAVMCSSSPPLRSSTLQTSLAYVNRPKFLFASKGCHSQQYFCEPNGHSTVRAHRETRYKEIVQLDGDVDGTDSWALFCGFRM